MASQKPSRRGNNERKYDYEIKTMILGDSAVGKTSYLLKLINDEFSLNHCATIGIDIKIKELEINGKRIKMQIWDSAGQEKYRNINETLYRGAIGLILMYSIADTNSFQNIERWIKDIHEHAVPGISKILVGNKCDMEDKRKVSREQGESMARKYDMGFIETSAKDGTGVQEGILMLATKVYDHVQELEADEETKSNNGQGRVAKNNNNFKLSTENVNKEGNPASQAGGCNC